MQESHAIIFCTLVSEDTLEMQYNGKRQQFLLNQGFTYQVKSHLAAQVGWLCWLFLYRACSPV